MTDTQTDEARLAELTDRQTARKEWVNGGYAPIEVCTDADDIAWLLRQLADSRAQVAAMTPIVVAARDFAAAGLAMPDMLRATERLLAAVGEVPATTQSGEAEEATP